MQPSKALAVAVVVVVALSVASAAAPCAISAETICQLNGAGVHCHPCKPDTYIVCTGNADYSVQTCLAGQVWDAYAASCAASSPAIGSCIPGASVLVPSSFFTDTANAIVDGQETADTDATRHPQKQQSWAQWAAAGLSTFVDSAKDQLTSLAAVTVPEQQQQQQQQPSSSYPDTQFMLPLRMTMVYGTDSPPQSQLQQMRQGLARAASLQEDAMLLVHDAEIAEHAAAQQMRAAHVLMSGDTELDSSSSSSSSGGAGDAAYQAGQLLRGAQEAQQAAAEMQQEAEVLLDAAASEVADVARAISGALDQPHSSSSSIGDSQRFYGPAMLSAILGTSAARSAEATAAAALEDEYYYDDSDDSYDADDSSFTYSGLYTYGDVDSYSYDDDDLMARPPPPAAAAGASVGYLSEHATAAAAQPHVFGPIPVSAAALLGHLAEVHGEDAYNRPDLLHWASRGGSITLPPSAWPSTGPVVALTPRFTSSSSSSSGGSDGSQHWLSEELYRDSAYAQADSEQQTVNFYDDAEDVPAAGRTPFSSSIIIGGALQDRLVKLAAAAAAATQQQLDIAASPAATSTSTSSSSSSRYEDVGDILEQLGPLPMFMTVKREQEMLQLAAVFDALYPKLSDDAASQLNDLDFSSPAVLDAVLVGGLPSLQLGPQLVGLMGPGDAAVLRSVLHAQMAELFADFVALSNAGATQRELTGPASQPFEEASLYDDTSNSDQDEVSSKQQGVSSSPAAKAAQPAAGFKDPALLQQLDDALLQIEAEKLQQQKQQQQQQQQREQGHKAAGLALPGLKGASTQQVL